MPKLTGKRIAFLATDGVEQVQFTAAWDALRAEGAEVELIAPHGGEIQAMKHLDKGDTFTVDRALNDIDPTIYDAVVIPGGVASPDFLRLDEQAVRLVRASIRDGKPVAAICHGPWLLVEADVLQDRMVTSWASLHTDIRNAGATWVDEEVVVDEGIITSRKPDDLPAFCAAMIERFGRTAHRVAS